MDGMPPSDISALGYEEARDELVRVVTQLEQGNATLEESISLWERGEALARHCEEWLIGAKARLDTARAGTVDASDAADGSSTGSGAVLTGTATTAISRGAADSE